MTGTTRRATVPAVAAVLTGANLLNNQLAPGWYLVTCPATAVALVGLARADGRTWAELGLDRAALRPGLGWAAALAGTTAAGYAVAAAWPVTRPALADARMAGVSRRGTLWRALVRIPLGTVLLEETAFRSVLPALLGRRYGAGAATAVSSLAFGLWHVLPSRGLRHDNQVAGRVFPGGPGGAVLAGAAAVAGTTAAGVILDALRRRGGLLAPAGLPWALNGLGAGFAWAVGKENSEELRAPRHS
jgi:membrane protease YdiL (CAAX protease family)